MLLLSVDYFDYFIIKLIILTFSMGNSAQISHLELNRMILVPRFGWHQWNWFPSILSTCTSMEAFHKSPICGSRLYLSGSAAVSRVTNKVYLKAPTRPKITDQSHGAMTRVILGPVNWYCQREGLVFQSILLPWTWMDDCSILLQATSICLDTWPTSNRQESQDPS